MLCRVFPIAHILIIGSFTTAVHAQISSDLTLRNNSIVNLSNREWQIQGGETVGNNLFHSFSQFNIGMGETAYFITNNPDITNIITRITGGISSNIDGIIKADGIANLFLINPHGIIFGANAKLNIGGSFLASTADSILFPDGSLFSATNPQPPPLLTINLPLGLQFGANPGGIAVFGTGHSLTFKGDPYSSPLQRGNNTPGLQVKSGNTLALIGGEITVNGGLLTGERGQIEIGSISDGKVTLNPINQYWNFSYPEVENYRDIRLSNAALIHSIGGGGSGINIVGQQVIFSDGSLALTAPLLDSLPGGSITVTASKLLSFSGLNYLGIPSALRSQAGTGNGGAITINTPHLIFTNGGYIHSLVFGRGNGGDITINAFDNLQLIGASPFSSGSLSGIESGNYGMGNGGDIKISTNRLQGIDGGIIVATTYSAGGGGNIEIKAKDSIELIGFNRVSPTSIRFRSVILAETIGSGNAGNLTIETSRLTVKDGARIGASTAASGDGGNLTVNASESIEVSGVGAGTSLTSFLSSSALANLPIQKFLGLPLVPSGNAGTLIVNTPKLIVSDRAVVGVNNQGLGMGGDMRITADEIILNREGRLTAATGSGTGGNIKLNLTNYLLLRHGSQITAEAEGLGNGGNITINSPFIIAVETENSDLIANALAGNGGKINMTSTGIFGLIPTTGSVNNSISEINASSQTGISGVVNINTPEVNPTSGLLEIPITLRNPSNQIVVGCAAAQGNSFTITGRGGLPENPTGIIRGQTIWHDLQDFSLVTAGENTSVVRSQSAVTNSENNQNLISDSQINAKAGIVEATGLVRDEQGNVILVAPETNPNPSSHQASVPNCHQLSSFGVPQ